jgi:SAM-dependent methyltransferase
MNVEFGQTSADYAQHRQGFPDELFAELRRFNIGLEGQAIADLGTGTGTLARGFARRGAAVTALDRAPEMVESARALAAREGLHIDFRVARAEETGLPGGSFDVVSAGQCWHWFDRPVAAAEALRLLRPEGNVVLAHLDWIAFGQNIAAQSEALMNRYNPHAPNMHVRFGGSLGIYREWLADLMQGGFVDLRSFSFDVNLTYTHEAWRGRCRASQWIGAALAPEQVRRFDDELRQLLQSVHPLEPMVMPHRVFAALGTRPGSFTR